MPDSLTKNNSIKFSEILLLLLIIAIGTPYFIFEHMFNINSILSLDNQTDILAIYGLNNGKIPYKDFQWVYGPIFLYLEFFIYKLMGANYYSYIFGKWIVINILGIIVAYGISYILYEKTWKRLFFTFLTVLFICSNMVSIRHLVPELILIYFINIILYKVITYKFCLISGVLFGISVLLSVEYGIASIILAVIATLISGSYELSTKFKVIIYLVFGAALPLCGYFIYLVSNGSLDNFAIMYSFMTEKQVLTNPARPEFLPVPFQNLFGNFKIINILSALFSLEFKFYVPLILYSAILLNSIYKIGWNKTYDKINLLLSIYGIIIYFRALVGPAYGFMTYGYIPFLIISCNIFYNYLKNKNTLKKSILWLITIVILFYAQDLFRVKNSYKNSLEELKNYTDYNNVVGAKVPKDFNDDIIDLNRFLQLYTSSNEEYFEYPYGIYSFLTGKKQFTQYNKYFENIYDTNFYHRFIINELINNKVRYILLNKRSGEVNIGKKMLNHNITYGGQSESSPIFAGDFDLIKEYILNNHVLIYENRSVALLQSSDTLKKSSEVKKSSEHFICCLVENGNTFHVGEPVSIKDRNTSIYIELPQPINNTRVVVEFVMQGNKLFKLLYKSKIHLAIENLNMETVSYHTVTDDMFTMGKISKLVIDSRNVRDGQTQSSRLKLVIESPFPHIKPTSIKFLKVAQFELPFSN